MSSRKCILALGVGAAVLVMALGDAGVARAGIIYVDDDAALGGYGERSSTNDYET